MVVIVRKFNRKRNFEILDEIYNELEYPVEYFVGNGFYNNIRQLIHRGPVNFDCNSAKEDYFQDSDTEIIVNAAGYDSYEVVVFNGREYIIVWN